MANTQILKKEVEPILRELFFKNTGFEELRIPGSELLGMQPDIIGRNGKTLILGEITVSGYMGKNKKISISGGQENWQKHSLSCIF